MENLNLVDLEVISGCMFAGKTTKLIKRITDARSNGLKVQVFKPSLDDRYGMETITTHNGNKINCYAVKNSYDIQDNISLSTQVIAIDEVQFFDSRIIQTILNLIKKDIKVVVAGLNLDFRGLPFGSMSTLLALADKITQINIECSHCHQRNASISQRLIKENDVVRPARFSDPIIMVGADDLYEPRCKKCHIVLPNAPKKVINNSMFISYPKISVNSIENNNIVVRADIDADINDVAETIECIEALEV